MKINYKKYSPTVCSVFDKGYRYGFNGMERDRDIANDDYDFGARIYDGRLGRWLSLDPLMEKYAAYSPFNFCINSPLTVIDYNGKDIIILFCQQQFNKGKGENGENHTTGHLAILIEGKNEKGESGFWFYSHDGPSDSKNKNDGRTIKFFSSLEDFKSSEYNTLKVNYDDNQGTTTSEKDQAGNVRTRFNAAIRISTSDETDKKMMKAANKQVKKNTYYLLMIVEQ